MLNHAGLKWRVVSSHPVILNVIQLGDSMAIRKKNSRLIHVDGIEYRSITRSTDGGVRVVVVAEGRDRSKLIIESSQNRAEQHVLPFEIAACIRMALDRGWGSMHENDPFRIAVTFGESYSQNLNERKPRFTDET